MNGTAARFVRLGVSLAGLVTLGWVLTGQAAKPARHGIPLPTDWSHHHLIFSRPGSAEQAARVSEDPRYAQQLHRRGERLALPAGEGERGATSDFVRAVFKKPGTKFKRDWSENLGMGAAAGAGNYPAKFVFESTVANCGNATTPDYVVYSTGLAGAAGQADIVAYDNLYSGCTGTVPSGYWAYNTSGTNSGTVLTSPVLSEDGSQIAFVQTNGFGAGTVVLLKWKASATDTVTAPTSLTGVLAVSYPACPAPCMTTLNLTDRTAVFTDDTTSSIFVDYSGDTAWVGDSRGLLHKFTPFFRGTPTEVRNAKWPAQVGGTSISLGSPVYDHASQQVFVGGVEDGTLYRVDPTTAAITASGPLEFSISFVAGPIVDSTNGFVYAFVSDDGSAGCTGGADCTGVIQLPTNFAAGSPGSEAIVGISAFGGFPQPQPLYDGGFDSNYINSVNATGNLYVCGNTGANPTLYVVPIQTGVMGNGVAITALATTGSTPACSPVTDMSDPGATLSSAATERIFASVQDNSSAACVGGGGAGCILNFVDTPWQASKAFTVGQTILIKSASPLTRLVDIAITAGTSGATQPGWPSTAGMIKTDGGITWLNQGNPNLPVPLWAPTHTYSVAGGRVLDSSGNIEIVKGTLSPNKSGPTPPPWNSTLGGTTVDNNIVWINAGTLPTVGLASTNGTSAIIIDNGVGSGTLPGASQVYFTTLGDQACGTSGTGGCAVQASQSALQ